MLLRRGSKVLLAATACLLVSAAQADTLIENVDGYTLDSANRTVRFSSLVIGDDGRVRQLVARGERRPTGVRYRSDGRGRTLIPGLIDAHGHVMGLGFQAIQLDLTGTTSLADLQTKLARYAAETPQPLWIVGRGWNQELWADKRFPTAADLDIAVPGRPVFLTRIDGHAAVANTAAMKLAGITAKTPVPAGGRIEKTGGAPNGLLIDAASDLVETRIPPPLPRTRDAALMKAQEIMLSNGLTAVADMGTSGEDWLVMRRIGDAGRLRVRILSYSAGLEPMLAIASGEPTPWLYGDRLRMAGVKLYADGALGSRGAFLKAPYADAPNSRGLQFLDDAKLRNLMSRAAMDGFQVAVHAIGDAANAQVLGAIEELSATYTGDRRWRIEHAQVVSPADIPRFGRLGIIASMQPVHQTSDRLMIEARLGAARLGGTYAWRSMTAAGARLAFGSDFPVESPNPFHGLAVAISRQDAAGQPPGGWFPEERVSFVTALAAFTKDAAYASFAESRLGTLEVGKYADFVIVDRDVFAATPAELRDTKVLETWVGGQKVWERK